MYLRIHNLQNDLKETPANENTQRKTLSPQELLVLIRWESAPKEHVGQVLRVKVGDQPTLNLPDAVSWPGGHLHGLEFRKAAAPFSAPVGSTGWEQIETFVFHPPGLKRMSNSGDVPQESTFKSELGISQC